MPRVLMMKQRDNGSGGPTPTFQSYMGQAPTTLSEASSPSGNQVT